jgi:hypothetical protein
MSQSGDATKEEKPLALVVFLGAGASRKADVWTTREFVTRFHENLKQNLGGLPARFRPFFDALRPPHDDVEALLKLLHQHIDLETEPMGRTVQREKSITTSAAIDLRDLLLDYIHHVCYVSADKIDYLRPLSRLTWYCGGGPLEVFTANYDTAIEVYCFKNGIEFNNGFQRTWLPDSLDRDEGVALKLYKLHGSATWWLSKEGRLVEVPVQWKSRDVTTYYGSQAESLVVYPYDPSKKIPISTLDLLPMLRNRLKRAKLALVVGYSFRDPDVREIFLDAAQKNPDFFIVLVSPEAHTIYENWLARTASGGPSQLKGRVVCLPFFFEKVFGQLVDGYLMPLRQGRERYWLAKSYETAIGKTPSLAESQDLQYTLMLAAQAGHFERVVEILTRHETKKAEWTLFIDVLPISYVMAALCGASEEEQFLRTRIAPTLESMPMNVQLSPQERIANGWKATGKMSMDMPRIMALRRDDLSSKLRELSKRLGDVCAMAPEDRMTESIRKLISALHACAGYLDERWPGHDFIPVEKVVEDGCRRNAEWNVIRDQLSTVGEVASNELLEEMRQCESRTFLNVLRNHWRE